jgi:DNA invertase Pin-like site-specific DNA recombinase
MPASPPAQPTGPKLQERLEYIKEHAVKYVIVHKIDRLARNRVDDVAINLAIQQAGATLISCTENIDETPSGALLHGIMSSIAEFYSRNLANEVIKGTQQKVKNGGTPSLAPIGYLNVRQIIDGREVRTVELDPERAPLIRWAFEVYATGEWSLNRLAHELEVRGLTQRPTAQRAARPLNAKKLAAVLHNPYYVGTVTWRGLQFDGKHPRLVSLELFAQVQAVLAAHRQSGERSYRRKHYLAGSIYCARCASKLIYSVSTGHRGEAYAYWFCLGRHTYKNGCDLPYLPAEKVEEQVVLAWAGEKLSEQQAALIRDNLLADLADYTRTTQEAAERLEQRAEAIERQRRKWAEKAFEGAVPGDIAREKQAELAQQLATIQTQRARLTKTSAEHEAVIRDATALLPHCGEAYRRGDDQLRRDYNQAWFERVLVDSEQGQTKVTSVTRTELFEALHRAEVRTEAEQQPEHAPAAEASVFEQVLGSESDENEQPGRVRTRVVHRVAGSNVALLVDRRLQHKNTLPTATGPDLQLPVARERQT